MQRRKKVPFSGKAKRVQLMKKKMSKNTCYLKKGRVNSSDDEGLEINDSYINKGHSNRYALKLHRETDAEIRQKREMATQEIIPVERTSLEIKGDQFFPDSLTFPRRPPWNFEMTRTELDMRENRYFTEYLANMHKKFDKQPISIDQNIENWRQLWRVTEMSDILLFVVDIRFPSILFPPFFYEYVTRDLKKEIIVVLNKIDLAQASLVAAWQGYFLKQYPQMKIVLFTSVPSYNLRQGGGSGMRGLRRKGKMRMAAEGAQKLQEVCQNLVKDNLDISSWKNKILEEMNCEYENVEIDVIIDEKEDTAYFEHQRFKEGVLTIGCVGQPNVGKSSLINSLMGRKVVSVSRTPGHTKHFQTIYLTKNVRLCDCPGLVFPSTVPKVLQVLMGSFPIAQVREPYSIVRYMAERLDLVKLLKISHPSKENEWSAMDICEGWAIKKGFFTAKAARPDTYRAANHLLRSALSGQIALCFMPPKFVEEEAMWQTCEDIDYIKWIQANKEDTGGQSDPCDAEDDDTEESDAEDEESASDHDVPSEEEDRGKSTKTENRFTLLNLSSSE